MVRGGEGFPSSRRLRHRSEYLRARARGRKVHTAHFLVYVAPSSGEANRLGLTVSRKIGGSVQRNRVKRLVREFFRRHQHCLAAKTDYSVIAKRGAAELDYETVCDELGRLSGQ